MTTHDENQLLDRIEELEMALEKTEKLWRHERESKNRLREAYLHIKNDQRVVNQ